MAYNPINPTQITPPRVNLIDERSGAISREWYRFFLSLLTATQTNQDEVELAPDATSLIATYDAMLETLAQTTETQPDPTSLIASYDAMLETLAQTTETQPDCCASGQAVLATDIQSLALAPPSTGGTVTSVDASGGTTGLTFSGGSITTSGTLTLGGTLAITNGGTGATTAALARTNLGATTLGSNVFTIPNPSAVTFPRFNADNTVSALDAATFRTAIGAGTGSGTVTSVAALTLGTTGTDLSSSVANGTTTPVITLNVPTASAANRGALSAADWTTFNGKQGPIAKSTSVFSTGTAQTYTAPAGTTWVKITVVGPGGNGGAAVSQRATGGGGGGVAIAWKAMTAGQTVVYTVGTASGTASTVSSGTFVIATITANSGTNGAGTAYALSQTAGGAGGAATGGDVNITGGQGGYSYGSSTTVTTNFSGKGGDCPGFGSGGAALAMVATAGVAGNGFGAGGGGAHGSNSAASGRGGVIIFEAY